jgi:hypothetical protein
LIKTAGALKYWLDREDISIQDITPLTDTILRIVYKDRQELGRQPITNSVPIGKQTHTLTNTMFQAFSSHLRFWFRAAFNFLF